jgi:glycosyltransferase involved in cell wall biosynthesis
MPRVTVIMATHNWATVLPYSIGSVLDQRYQDFELLVIGDGCTDESADVVATVDDSRVKWHNLPENTGHQSGPNNEGISRADGELIAYLGHDDLWLPCHLELLVAAIDGVSRMAHTSVCFVPPTGRPTAFPGRGWVYKPEGSIPPTCVAHDRTLVDEAGGWRSPRHTGVLESEGELWERMVSLSHPPRWVPRLTCVKFSAGERQGVYRRRPNYEQADWLTRIRETRDPEGSLLATCTRGQQEGIRRRIFRIVGPRVRVRTRLRSAGLLRPLPSAEERWRTTRRFKGLDDEPSSG